MERTLQSAGTTGAKRFVIPPAVPHPTDDGTAALGHTTGNTTLVALDADVVGLAELYLKAGRLTAAERATLRDRQNAAEALADQLQIPERAYAHQLVSLAHSLLDATGDR